MIKNKKNFEKKYPYISIDKKMEEDFDSISPLMLQQLYLQNSKNQDEQDKVLIDNIYKIVNENKSISTENITNIYHNAINIECKDKVTSSKIRIGLPLNNEYFVKISEGHLEHENLSKIRNFLSLKEEITEESICRPLSLHLGVIESPRNNINIYFNVPLSHTVDLENTKKETITIAKMAGNKSFKEFIDENTDGIDEQKIVNIGQIIGKTVAIYHNSYGLSHGDLHLNNIRVDAKGKQIYNIHIIDIESAADNIDEDFEINNKMSLADDFRELLNKTFAHKLKDTLYGVLLNPDAKKYLGTKY